MQVGLNCPRIIRGIAGATCVKVIIRAIRIDDLEREQTDRRETATEIGGKIDSPGGMVDEGTAVQESKLGEQHGTDEGHRPELLKVDLHREFILLLLHHEGHLTEARTPHLEFRRARAGPRFRPPCVRKLPETILRVSRPLTPRDYTTQPAIPGDRCMRPPIGSLSSALRCDRARGSHFRMFDCRTQPHQSHSTLPERERARARARARGCADGFTNARFPPPGKFSPEEEASRMRRSGRARDVDVAWTILFSSYTPRRRGVKIQELQMRTARSVAILVIGAVKQMDRYFITRS